MKFDSEKFSKALKTKRIIDDAVIMDEAADQIGISKATLSRLERGKTPDLLTYAKVCAWLKSDFSTFIKNTKHKP